MEAKEMKEGEYYSFTTRFRVENNNSIRFLGKRSFYYMCPTQGRFKNFWHKSFRIYDVHIPIDIQPATQEEINWLEECRKQGKFVPKPEFCENYSIF